jgi:hypothetical protein
MTSDDKRVKTMQDIVTNLSTKKFVKLKGLIVTMVAKCINLSHVYIFGLDLGLQLM